MINGEIIFKKLLEKNIKSSYEWAKYDDFTKTLAVLISQNSKWHKAKIALENLRSNSINSLNDLVKINKNTLEELLKPSGFYKSKAKQILDLANAILKDFASFEDFRQNASFEWLISIKGIGFESASKLANYVLKEPIFVINQNAKKLLLALDYEAQSYEEASEILSSGLDDAYFYELLELNDLADIYMFFNACIDEFITNHYKKSDELSQEVLGELL